MRAAADSHHPPVPENEFSQSSRFKRASKRLRRLAAIGAVWRIRSERQLMEQLDYNLLYRWFVGLSPDDLGWDPTVFTKNRDRLQNGEVFAKFMTCLLYTSDAADE